MAVEVVCFAPAGVPRLHPAAAARHTLGVISQRTGGRPDSPSRGGADRWRHLIRPVLLTTLVFLLGCGAASEPEDASSAVEAIEEAPSAIEAVEVREDGPSPTRPPARATVAVAGLATPSPQIQPTVAAVETPTVRRPGRAWVDRVTTPDATATPEPTATAEPTATPEPTVVAPADATALITPNGIVVPVMEYRAGSEAAEERWAVLTPCGQPRDVLAASFAGELVGSVAVVIDPGHGGSEPGTSGPAGLTEKAVNLDIANRTIDWLRARGVSVLSTRTGDYRVPIMVRGELTRAVQPDVFVSIHHNGGPATPIDEPGTEIFHQWDNDDSRRLGGLLFDEIFEALDSVPGDHDFEATSAHHTQWRLNGDGDADLYGVLRRSAEAGVVGVLTEAMFMNTAGEEALLARPEVRQLEAEAIGRAIVRYLAGEDPVDGSFDDGIVFQGTLVSSGGVAGCVDPELQLG